MKLRRIWESSLSIILLFWIVVALIIRPGWGYFLLGFLAWVLLTFLSAPGVFWSYAACFIPNPVLGEKLLAKAISYQPLIPTPYLTLGLSYARRKEWSQAIPLLETAVAHTPEGKRTQNLTWLAEAYRARGFYEQALSTSEKLLKMGANTTKVLLNLALVHLQLNHLSQALEYAEKARTGNLSATEPVLIQAKIHFLKGEYQQAKNDYQWVIEHLKYPVESLYWLGRSELELGETEAAINHLQTAVERITADPLLADVSKEEAEEWLNRAIESKQTKKG
ncbi:MAG: tetratricopeptide repeat protein [Bacteroidota bacterium]